MPLIYTAGRVNELLGALTRGSVGLSNVDNTSDANKPVSTATTAAIATAVAGQVRVALWDGTVYKIGGVTVTANNRPNGAFIEFLGGPDPVTLGLGVINGDKWKDAA